jgi:hypothetical protein
MYIKYKFIKGFIISGIQFVIDDKGAKSAVIIDLNKYADLLADFMTA